MITYERSTLDEQRKVYWAGRSSRNDLGRGVDFQGKLVIGSILETKASSLLEFFPGLRGSLFVTFEEGTWAAWLYDLLKPHVTEVLVCNPGKIPLLKQGQHE